MIEYGNKFVVYVQESMHTNYDMAPQTKVDIYGIYSSFDRAEKGLRDCAKIAERVYSHNKDEETVVSRLVEDNDQIVILRHCFYKMMRHISRHTSLITIKISREF